MVNDKFSLLPEIYVAFGRDQVLKFLDIFGGTTIKVPSHDALLKTVRDVHLYLEVEGRIGGKPTFSELAHKYGISKSMALKAYHAMKERIKTGGFLLEDDFIPGVDDYSCQETEQH